MNDKELADRLSNLHEQALALRDDVKQLKSDAKAAGFSRVEIKVLSKITAAVVAGKEFAVAGEIKAMQEMAARVGCEALAGEQLRLPIPKAAPPAVAPQTYPKNKWAGGGELGGGSPLPMPGDA